MLLLTKHSTNTHIHNIDASESVNRGFRKIIKVIITNLISFLSVSGHHHHPHHNLHRHHQLHHRDDKYCIFSIIIIIVRNPIPYFWVFPAYLRAIWRRKRRRRRLQHELYYFTVILSSPSAFPYFDFKICFCIWIVLLYGYPVKSNRLSIFLFQDLFLYLYCIILRLSWIGLYATV